MIRCTFAIVFTFMLLAGGRPAQDKKDDKAKKPEMGSVTGVVVSKGEAWIEVKADNEARPRRYVARWKDAADAKKIKDAAVDARVKLDWTMIDSRPRVDKIETSAGGEPGKKPEPEKKPDSEAPPPRLKK